jgi:hypothetical protein
MSKIKSFLLTAAAVALGMVSASNAFAGVSLLLTDGDASPSSTTVTAGNSFPVNVTVLSTSTAPADQVIGFNYFLNQTSGPTPGVFTITSRNTSGGGAPGANNPFSFVINTDSQVLDNSGPTFNATLNPRNNVDLGASLNDVTKAVGKNNTPFNPYLVAAYTLAVSPNAAPGVYTITTFSPAGQGYSDAQFNDRLFSAPPANTPYNQTFSVTVVAAPEPTSAMLIGAVIVGFGFRRRRFA